MLAENGVAAHTQGEAKNNGLSAEAQPSGIPNSIANEQIATDTNQSVKGAKDSKSSLPESLDALLNTKNCLLCVFCMVDLEGLQCALDLDTDEYICLGCFAMGKESPTGHKVTNRYKIIQNLSVPLFTSTWSLKEEMLLLEGIKLTGFGNWTDVAKTVGSKTWGRRNPLALLPRQ